MRVVQLFKLVVIVDRGGCINLDDPVGFVEI